MLAWSRFQGLKEFIRKSNQFRSLNQNKNIFGIIYLPKQMHQ